MRFKLKRWIKLDVIAILIASLYYTILSLFNETCLIKGLFHISCPTCGMTRAILCFLHGNLKGYFDYHPLALPTLFVFYFSLHIRDVKHKYCLNVLSILLAFAILLRYLIITF